MKSLFKTIVVLLTIIALLLGFVAQVQASDGQIDTKGLLEAISPALQVILETVVTVLAALAAYYARLYMVQLVEKIRQNTTQEQFWLIRTIVDQLVAAAEQVYKEGAGEEKKQFVLKQAEQAMANYGLKLDLATLDAIIEAAVYDRFKTPIWNDGTVSIKPA